MKTKAIISEIKKCIKRIESYQFDMAVMSRSFLNIRRYLYSLGMEELGDEVKSIGYSLSSDRFSRRSVVSRLETVIRSLSKIDSSLSKQTQRCGINISRTAYDRCRGRSLSRFDLVFVPTVEGYRLCVIVDVMPNEYVVAYPIVSPVMEKNYEDIVSSKAKGVDICNGVYLSEPRMEISYKDAQYCFVERLDSSSVLGMVGNLNQVLNRA